MPTPRSLLGARAEEIAAQRLVRRGFDILCRNFRRREGEIDIIARDGDTLVFVEVRSHSTANFGSPAESVIPSKLKKLAAVATMYIQETGSEETPCRFDLVEVYFRRGKLEKVNHIRNILETG